MRAECVFSEPDLYAGMIEAKSNIYAWVIKIRVEIIDVKIDLNFRISIEGVHVFIRL